MSFTTQLSRLVTLNDNKTPDLYPILLSILVLGFLGYTGYNIYNGSPFNPMDYGIGAGSLLGGGGAAKRLDKDNTEVEDLSGKEKP